MLTTDLTGGGLVSTRDVVWAVVMERGDLCDTGGLVVITTLQASPVTDRTPVGTQLG